MRFLATLPSFLRCLIWVAVLAVIIGGSKEDVGRELGLELYLFHVLRAVSHLVLVYGNPV